MYSIYFSMHFSLPKVVTRGLIGTRICTLTKIKSFNNNSIVGVIQSLRSLSSLHYFDFDDDYAK